MYNKFNRLRFRIAEINTLIQEKEIQDLHDKLITDTKEKEEEYHKVCNGIEY